MALMPRFAPTFRFPVLAGALLVAGVLSCGREITGPGGGGRAGTLALNPQFASIRLGGTGEVLSIGSVVDFNRVRIVLLRANGDTAVDTLVTFPPGADSLKLQLFVQLGQGATAAGEQFDATMKYVNAAGDTVFSGGPISVQAKPVGTSGTSAAVTIPIRYSGVGADAASIEISPTMFNGLISGQTTFTAIVRDSDAVAMPLAPVAFTSTDSGRVRVNLRSGVTTLLGARGGAQIIAQTLTGQADTADVAITPVPTSLVVISGANQQVRQGEPFANPIRVRAVAVDGLGVANVFVGFDVLQGQGSTNQFLDTTDVNGDAQVTWTAGDSAGTAVLRATIVESVIGVNIGGQQLSSAATSLAFGSQPGNITSGDSIAPFTVIVRDATGDTVSTYNSSVTVSLTGGTGGANVVGPVNVTAVAGVAVFRYLSVDRGGTGYRFVASLPGLPAVTPVQSNTFNAAAAPPRFLTVVGGAGQTAPPSTILPDSVKVRVTDTFGFNVAGVTVNFAVAAGGGSISPTSAVTDASGRAAARWTLGATGAQQVSAAVSGLTTVFVTASLPVVGGTPVLFLGLEAVDVPIGRTRQVPVFLTNPTPSPLTVTLAVRSPVASWNTASLVIPASGNSAFPFLTGNSVGQAWAVASSSAGTDSVLVTVDSSFALIDAPPNLFAHFGDTIRVLVMIPEPAGVGGVVLTVRSTDSTDVLVAPGTGGGVQDPCYLCVDLRAEPTVGGSLLAPFAGTALITIPQGQLSAQLVILPVTDTNDDFGTPLLLEGSGLVGTGLRVFPRAPEMFWYVSDLSLGVGQQGVAEIYLAENSRRTQTVRFSSLNPAVLAVDSIAAVPRNYSYSGPIAYRGVAPGTAELVAVIDGFAPETTTITVLPARLQAYAYSSVALAIGDRGELSAFVGYDVGGFFSYGSATVAPLRVTVTSRTPSVIRPEFGSMLVPLGAASVSIGLEALAGGSSWIVIEAAGYLADSIEFSGAALGLSLAGNIGRLGVGLTREDIYISRNTVGTSVAPVTLTVSSSDESILRVLSPTVTIQGSQYYAYARLEGRTLGTVTLTVSAPGHGSSSLPVQVFPSSLVLSSYSTNQTINPDSASRAMAIYTSDGLYQFPPADTVNVKLRSTNPSVLLVSDSTLEVSSPNAYATGGAFRPIASGTAQLIISAPGFAPDTSGIITVSGPRLILSTTNLPIGIGLQALTSVARTSATGAVVPFTVSIQGTGGSTVSAPNDSFPAGVPSRLIRVNGGTSVGTDTLIVSAAGMIADTLFVGTYGTRVLLSGVQSTLEVGEEYPYLDVRMRNLGNSLVQPSRDTTRILVQSRDTSIVKVLPDTFRILPGGVASSPYGTTRGMAPGRTWLVATHLNGAGLADSVQVTVATPRLSLSNYGPLVMGMQEQTYAYQYYVTRERAHPEALWVRLTSTAPGIVSVPDSVLIPADDYYAYFEITSGDTTGSAMITATTTGYASSNFPVFVTRSQLAAYQYDNLAVGGRSYLEVYRTSTSYSSYPSTVPIPLRVTVADTSIARMTPDTLTMLAGDVYYVYWEWLRGVAPGRTQLTVADRRPGNFRPLLDATTWVEVVPRRLYADTYGPLFATPGTNSNESEYVYVDGYSDSTWVQLRSVGGRFAPSADSVLIEGYSGATYGIFGLTNGTDTLVVSAPGFAPDSILVRVGPGTFLYANLPTSIRQGDSVQVTLYLRTAGGSYAYATAPMTLAIAATPAVQATNGTAPITSVQAGIGAYYVSFWVKALAPGGGTITVTHPNFLPFAMTVGTRSP